MDIEVVELKVLNTDRPIKAFADIRLDGWLTIRGFRVIQREGKRPRVEPPQASWRGALGNIMYKRLLTMPDEIAGRIHLEILQQYVRVMEEQNEGQVQNTNP
jgi:DNA-binding cell septation regulator SpoVG